MTTGGAGAGQYQKYIEEGNWRQRELCSSGQPVTGDTVGDLAYKDTAGPAIKSHDKKS